MELLHLAPDNEMFHCPYNNSHTMLKKRLSKHLIKCKDKPDNFVRCFYNFNHAIPKSELEDHQENCPDRGLLDTAIYQSEDMKRSDNDCVRNASSTQSPMKHEESWNVLDFCEALQTIKTKTISMRANHNMTKAERKQHRKNLHKNEINCLNI